MAGGPVSIDTQKNFGLVTVGGGCSGTLLNRFWVLTADHCVAQADSTGNVGTTVPIVIGTTTVNKTVGLLPNAALSALTVTAAWSTRTVTPTRVVRNWRASGTDIALLFLGAGDFGYDANVQLFFVDPLSDGSSGDPASILTKFGQGISVYANAGPPPMPASGLGVYRTAVFAASSFDGIDYNLAANTSGQVGNGGDSGGPDWATAPNGVLLGIAGVQSTCIPTGYVPSQPQTWTWATGVNSCRSAAVVNARWDIVNIVQEGRRPCEETSAGCAITETTSLTLMLH